VGEGDEVGVRAGRAVRLERVGRRRSRKLLQAKADHERRNSLRALRGNGMNRAP
jgi:hypothetical protein